MKQGKIIRKGVALLLAAFMIATSFFAFDNKIYTTKLPSNKQFATKAEAEKRLQKKGAIIKKNVVKSLDYLIVGGNGNENWSCGNYGSKVKRAL